MLATTTDRVQYTVTLTCLDRTRGVVKGKRICKHQSRDEVARESALACAEFVGVREQRLVSTYPHSRED